jgi:radical SAM protein with 4Fe4S-binding SPASM domain
MGPVDTSSAARIVVRGAPAYVWSYDTQEFEVEVENDRLPELAAPDASHRVVAEVDLHRTDGTWLRRVASRPLPEPVAVGERRRFRPAFDIRAFAGDYELRLALRSVQSPNPAPLAVGSTPLRVKNTIHDAFIELINACNFRCTFCPQTTLQRKQRPMDFELATKVVRDLADMGHHYPIRVHLLGEPLLYPRFFDFVDMAHDHGQRICLATNGSRFSKKNIEGIFRSRLDEMVISLNTPEEELYLQQRGSKVSYQAYVAGIEEMVSEIARRGAPPRTRVNVLFEAKKCDSPEELERVRHICDEWIDVARRSTGKDLPPAQAVVHLEPGATTLVELLPGLELQWTAYHNWGEGGGSKEIFCSYPWRQLAILVDGQATACCIDAEGEISLGNARETSVEEIWNGPRLNRLREGFMQGLAAHPRCARCDVRHDKREFFPA